MEERAKTSGLYLLALSMIVEHVLSVCSVNRSQLVCLSKPSSIIQTDLQGGFPVKCRFVRDQLPLLYFSVCATVCDVVAQVLTCCPQ